MVNSEPFLTSPSSTETSLHSVLHHIPTLHWEGTNDMAGHMVYSHMVCFPDFDGFHAASGLALACNKIVQACTRLRSRQYFAYMSLCACAYAA